MKNILIVDDDKTNLTSAKGALSDIYKIIAVTSGAQALKFLENNTCDLILLDINMPGMDGFEVMDKIRKTPGREDIPIIFLTADTDPDTENRCLEAGAVDFIPKPFVHNVMRSRIRRTIELDGLQKNLAEKLEERTRHVVYIQQQMVLGMATMVESRDLSTGGHIKRTSKVVEVFAKKLYGAGLGLSRKFLDIVVRAAPMHDLGKIAVDDAVLRKQSKFNNAEYEKMKMHSAEGAKIVKQLLEGVEEPEFVDIAVNVAHYHHEKWDGTGYPDGLKGEQIPVEARIMALADVFDALISKRCYKEPFSYDTAFDIISDSLGTHFDPVLGKIFLSCRPELEAMYNSFNLIRQ